MRIGIVPVANPHLGGIYQYSATMLETLRQYAVQGCDDDFVVFSEGNLPDGSGENAPGWTVRSLSLCEPAPLAQRILEFLRDTIAEGPQRNAVRALLQPFRQEKREVDLYRLRRQAVINERFCREGVDLMLYPSPLPVAFETEIPYVMAIHDLQHRLQPEFPEVSADGEWERREYLFRNGTRYATLLLADSEVGKEDILNFYEPYGVTPDQVKVLPFLPACYLHQKIWPRNRNASGQCMACPNAIFSTLPSSGPTRTTNESSKLWPCSEIAAPVSMWSSV